MFDNTITTNPFEMHNGLLTIVQTFDALVISSWSLDERQVLRRVAG